MIEVEKAFDVVVGEIGGGRVSDRVGPSPPFDNADYVFDRCKVIVELKCLEEDKIKDAGMIEKASALYARELQSGRAPVVVFGQVRMTTEGFSDEFARQIFGLYQKPIQKRFEGQ
jgi:hypothetical protein